MEKETSQKSVEYPNGKVEKIQKVLADEEFKKRFLEKKPWELEFIKELKKRKIF